MSGTATAEIRGAKVILEHFRRVDFGKQVQGFCARLYENSRGNYSATRIVTS